jgi:hypothetical protein
MPADFFCSCNLWRRGALKQQKSLIRDAGNFKGLAKLTQRKERAHEKIDGGWMSVGVSGDGGFSRIFERRGGRSRRWCRGRSRKRCWWRCWRGRRRRCWRQREWSRGRGRRRCWSWGRERRRRDGQCRPRSRRLDRPWPQCVGWARFERFGRPRRQRVGNPWYPYRSRYRKRAGPRSRSGRRHRKPGDRSTGRHRFRSRRPEVTKSES